MAGCGASGTTADTSYSAENPLVLTLAHGLSEAHTVHIAMTQFAEEVNEKTDGRVQVKIFPNGQLGSENENLEQLQAGFRRSAGPHRPAERAAFARAVQPFRPVAAMPSFRSPQCCERLAGRP